MRIYSNTLLSWPIALHISQTSRIYPGKWFNYHYYKISNIHPLIINTYSPIELLQENCKYYCYNKYYRDKRSEIFHNTFKIVNNFNQKSDFGKETWIYIPKIIEINDIIVIKKNKTPNIYPSLPINIQLI
jgi:hypothetical protein